MALLNVQGAALYTQLAIKGTAGVGTPIFLDIPGLRGNPSIGGEANLFSIPAFNQATAGSGVGQSELPDFEFEINYKPGDVMHQTLSHLFGMLQTAGQTTCTVTESNATSTQIFTPGLQVSAVLELKTVSGSADVAAFTFNATVAGFNFAPGVDDQTIATVTLALDALPIGPSGTAIAYDTPASVAFS